VSHPRTTVRRMVADDVPLTDLEVLARSPTARGAAASRSAVVAALRRDPARPSGQEEQGARPAARRARCVRAARVLRWAGAPTEPVRSRAGVATAPRPRRVPVRPGPQVRS